MVSAPACVLRFFMIRPHAMATLVRDVAVSVSVCHLHTEQKLHGRRPHLAAACMPSCSPPAPLTHPLAVSCLPSQLCFLSTWAAPVLAREPKRRRAQQFIMGGARTGERTMGGARTGENCSEHCRLRAQQIQVRVMLAQCVSKTAGFSHNVTQANPSTK